MRTEVSLPYVRYESELVDGVDFPDGCEVSPSCLNCPLDFCKFEVPVAVQRRLRRLVEIRKLRDEGHPVEDIARSLGITKRSCYRDLAVRVEEIAPTIVNLMTT